MSEPYIDEDIYDSEDEMLYLRKVDAIKYGVGAAITLHYLIYWMVSNKHDDKRKVDSFQQGRYWVFRSRSKMAKDTGLSEDTLRRHINTFVEEGLLITGCFNKLDYDKTIWYAVNDPEEFAKWEKRIIAKWEGGKKKKKKKELKDSGGKMPPGGWQDATDNTNINTNINTKVSKDTFVMEPAPSNDPFGNSIKGKQTNEIVDYWNALPGVTKLTIKRTKTFDVAVALISKALKEYDPDDILAAMHRYRHIKIMPGTVLKANYKISLPSFFKAQNPYDQAYNERLNIRSWFDECINNEKPDLQRKFSRARPDNYPKVSAAIKRAWEQSPYYEGKVNQVDENYFRFAAEKVVDWIEDNRGKYYFREFEDKYPEKFAYKFLIKCIEYSKPNIRVTTSWLKSDKTFNDRLHNYLTSQGKGAAHGVQ